MVHSNLSSSAGLALNVGLQALKAGGADTCVNIVQLDTSLDKFSLSRVLGNNELPISWTYETSETIGSCTFFLLLMSGGFMIPSGSLDKLPTDAYYVTLVKEEENRKEILHVDNELKALTYNIFILWNAMTLNQGKTYFLKMTKKGFKMTYCDIKECIKESIL